MQSNKTTREKAIEYVRQYCDENKEIIWDNEPFPKNHLFCKRGEHCEFIEKQNFIHVYLYPTPTEQVEGDVLEDWFYNNIDGDNAVVSDSIGFILEAPNEATGIELCKRYNGYPRLANRVKELETKLSDVVNGLIKSENKNKELSGDNEILKELARECYGYFSAPNFTDRYGTAKRLKSALQQNK